MQREYAYFRVTPSGSFVAKTLLPGVPSDSEKDDPADPQSRFIRSGTATLEPGLARRELRPSLVQLQHQAKQQRERISRIQRVSPRAGIHPAEEMLDQRSEISPLEAEEKAGGDKPLQSILEQQKQLAEVRLQKHLEAEQHTREALQRYKRKKSRRGTRKASTTLGVGVETSNATDDGVGVGSQQSSSKKPTDHPKEVDPKEGGITYIEKCRQELREKLSTLTVSGEKPRKKPVGSRKSKPRRTKPSPASHPNLPALRKQVDQAAKDAKLSGLASSSATGRLMSVVSPARKGAGMHPARVYSSITARHVATVSVDKLLERMAAFKETEKLSPYGESLVRYKVSKPLVVSAARKLLEEKYTWQGTVPGARGGRKLGRRASLPASTGKSASTSHVMPIQPLGIMVTGKCFSGSSLTGLQRGVKSHAPPTKAASVETPPSQVTLGGKTTSSPHIAASPSASPVRQVKQTVADDWTHPKTKPRQPLRVESVSTADVHPPGTPRREPSLDVIERDEMPVSTPSCEDLSMSNALSSSPDDIEALEADQSLGQEGGSTKACFSRFQQQPGVQWSVQGLAIDKEPLGDIMTGSNVHSPPKSKTKASERCQAKAKRMTDDVEKTRRPAWTKSPRHDESTDSRQTPVLPLGLRAPPRTMAEGSRLGQRGATDGTCHPTRNKFVTQEASSRTATPQTESPQSADLNDRHLSTSSSTEEWEKTSAHRGREREKSATPLILGIFDNPCSPSSCQTSSSLLLQQDRASEESPVGSGYSGERSSLSPVLPLPRLTKHAATTASTWDLFSI